MQLPRYWRELVAVADEEVVGPVTAQTIGAIDDEDHCVPFAVLVDLAFDE